MGRHTDAEVLARPDIIYGPAMDDDGYRVTRLRRVDGSEFTVTVPPLGMISEPRWNCWHQVNAVPWVVDDPATDRLLADVMGM